MVRISIVDTASTRTLLVEGKLVEPWTNELEKAWNNASHDLRGRNLAIDLRNVTLISPEGENTLLELIKSGAKFSCRGVLNKHILKQLARKSGNRLRDMLVTESSTTKKKLMEAKMLEATGKRNMRAAEYANARDFCRIFDNDMNSLYKLALLLTGDHEKAQQSFVAGLEDATRRNTVFKEWARSWARRVIVQNALRLVNPRPGGENTAAQLAAGQRGDIENPEIRAVLEMQPFDRFVFVLSVLEGYSDHECAILLECTRPDVLAARTRAFEHIGRAAQFRDAQKRNSTPAEAEFDGVFAQLAG